MDDTRSNAEVIAALAASVGIARIPLAGETGNGAEGQFTVVPEGYRLQSLEALFDRPRLITARVRCATVESFVAYVTDFLPSSQGVALAFAEESRGAITCVLDYDKPGSPSRRSHVCELCLEPTKEWMAWVAQDGKAMPQETFAKFLEDNLLDVVTPDGATLLEVASSLEVRKGVQFLSATRLQDGQRQFNYQETNETAAKGNIQMPERIVLGIAPWKGCDPYRIEARIRYRISGEKGLSLWFDLVRPHRVVTDAFRSILTAVREQAGIRVLEGKLGS